MAGFDFEQRKMRKSGFPPAQTAKALKEFDQGKTVSGISREHGARTATFCKRRSKYAGVGSKGLRPIKELEDGGPQAQTDVCLSSPGPSNGEGSNGRKALRPCRERSIGRSLVHHGIGRACRALDMSKGVYCRKPLPKDDAEIGIALQEKAVRHPEEGLWKAYGRLRSEGRPWNHERVHHRAYKASGAPLCRKAKKRPPARTKGPLEMPEDLNGARSMDFVADTLGNKGRFRAFTVIDGRNGGALRTAVYPSLPSNRVARVPGHLVDRRGKPNQDTDGQRPWAHR